MRRDINAENIQKVLKAMDTLEERTKYYIGLAQGESTLIKRLSGVGKLSYDDAVRLGAVGPTARASGVDRDVRRDDPYAAYSEITFNVITDDHCDVYGRTVVRLKELMECYSIVRQILKKLPEGAVNVKVPRKIPPGEAVGRYEAPRGEDLHYVRANGTEKPDRVKMRPPTLANIQVVSHMLQDSYLADLPIVIAAIDPCFSCTDRMVALENRRSRKKDVVLWEKLRADGIVWYQKQGLDFKSLNDRLSRKFKE